MTTELEPEHTITEVAAHFRCGERKIANIAIAIGVGTNWRGQIGWRFTDTEMRQIREAMRPKPAKRLDRRKRIA